MFSADRRCLEWAVRGWCERLHERLLFEAIEGREFRVRTLGGLTSVSWIISTVLQGGNWSHALAAVVTEKIGREIENRVLGFLYKEQLLVGILSLLDETLAVSKVAHEEEEHNALINITLAYKKTSQISGFENGKFVYCRHLENWIFAKKSYFKVLFKLIINQMYM